MRFRYSDDIFQNGHHVLLNQRGASIVVPQHNQFYNQNSPIVVVNAEQWTHFTKDKYPKMQLFVTEMCVLILVHGTGALWDLCSWSIVAPTTLFTWLSSMQCALELCSYFFQLRTSMRLLLKFRRNKINTMTADVLSPAMVSTIWNRAGHFLCESEF